jgi:hypothetical protein
LSEAKGMDINMKKKYVFVILSLLILSIIFCLNQNNIMEVYYKNPKVLINKICNLDESKITSINMIIMKEDRVESSYFFPGSSPEVKDNILNLVKNIQSFEHIKYPTNKQDANYFFTIDIESSELIFHVAFFIDTKNNYLNLVEISNRINSSKILKTDIYYLLNKTDMEMIKRFLT